MGRRRREKKSKFLQMAEAYKGSAEPRCPYFGKCGGCVLQDVSYENQLKLKKEHLTELLGDLCEVKCVNGTEPYAYRNRMDFVTAFGKKGLRERGTFKFVVDIEQCPIMQERSNEVFRLAREGAAGIPDFDYLKHEGYLRYIVLRQGAFSQQVMCNFVVYENSNRLQSVIDKIYDKVDSISILESPTLADTSFGPVVADIKNGFIEETFEDIRYRIAPNTFFQSNSRVALDMYRIIRENASGKVLDLYSGVGTISLFVAKGAESVTGVELNAESVAAAKVNAEINGITNVNFVAQDARIFMKENVGKYDTLILDPPREGIHPKMINYIEEFAPPKIIYMSCNPSTFKDNVELLANYRIKSFDAFDMFPQTHHAECVSVLERV